MFKDDDSGYNFYPQLLKKDNFWHFWIKAATDSGSSVAKLKCNIRLKNGDTGVQFEEHHKKLYSLSDSTDDIICDEQHISMNSQDFNKLLNISTNGKVASVKVSLKIRQC